jgi:hypothetical protein
MDAYQWMQILQRLQILYIETQETYVLSMMILVEKKICQTILSSTPRSPKASSERYHYNNMVSNANKRKQTQTLTLKI